MAGRTGLEPATSCVTGRRSNRLNYHPLKKGTNNNTVLEAATFPTRRDVLTD